MSSQNEETVFASGKLIFPKPKEDKIDTLEFLEAAKGVVTLIDLFGTIFSVVKLDMNGNITKLTKQYQKSPSNHSTLHDMIIAEKQQGGIFATDALLWLKRALHFFQVFLEAILKDSENGEKVENVSPHLTVAYQTTLERYHNFIIRKTFGFLCSKCPNRSKLVLTMSKGVEGREEAVIRDLAPVVTSLKQTIAIIDQLYLDNELDLEAGA
ncbi:glycolipid transfer protein [Neocloeon triangulifer]|uniref:glycolipid transfer protein n=1 Tax=Neocloeon triangulifer TaxID=2078957 RepID=UPI00286F4F03|nr:glycolipid transfer protein [Neocloeon triangulifer]